MYLKLWIMKLWDIDEFLIIGNNQKYQLSQLKIDYRLVWLNMSGCVTEKNFQKMFCKLYTNFLNHSVYEKHYTETF